VSATKDRGSVSPLTWTRRVFATVGMAAGAASLFAFASGAGSIVISILFGVTGIVFVIFGLSLKKSLKHRDQ